MGAYANSDVLIETEDLQKSIGDESLRIIEVDEDTSLYEKGHIPTAVSWNWKTDLHEPVRREIVDKRGLEALLRRSGVGASTSVVLYGGNNNWFAAYAYWLLKYRGFDNVKLMNGGRKKWELEARELASERPKISEPSDPVALPEKPRDEFRAHRDDVLKAARDGSQVFVDVRSPEEYRGDLLAPPHLPQEQSQVPGHIPGAVNVVWARAANEDGTFKDADELRDLYAQEGVSSDAGVVAYCRIGERSSHTWFVLRELLGFADVKNYDGSWTEYGSLVGAPVEK